jgi:diacylglycerol kinase
MESHENYLTDAIGEAVVESINKAIETISDGISKKHGKFLDDNKDDLITSIAAAIAASYRARHP